MAFKPAHMGSRGFGTQNAQVFLYPKPLKALGKSFWHLYLLKNVAQVFTVGFLKF